MFFEIYKASISRKKVQILIEQGSYKNRNIAKRYKNHHDIAIIKATKLNRKFTFKHISKFEFTKETLKLYYSRLTQDLYISTKVIKNKL